MTSQDEELLEASRNGDVPGVFRALEAGANPNAKDEDINTSLHYLLKGVGVLLTRRERDNERLKAVQVLIERGAEVHLDDRLGKTALDCAYRDVKDRVLEWYRATGRSPKALQPFCEWHHRNKEHLAQFLKILSANGDKLTGDDTLEPGQTYSTMMNNEGGKELDDFHTLHLKPFAFVSKRVKEFLSRSLPSLEFTPIDVLKGSKKVANCFLILAPLVDCLDVAKSEPIMGFDDEINDVRQRVLDESRIPRDVRLFRVTSVPNVLIVRQELADALRAAGLGEFNLRPLRR